MKYLAPFVIFVFAYILGAFSNNAVFHPVVESAERQENVLIVYYTRNPFSWVFGSPHRLILPISWGHWESICDENVREAQEMEVE